MSSIVPIIPPIDLAANQQRTRDILDLYSEKFTILGKICDEMEKKNTRNWQYFDYAIEMWQLQGCLIQKRLDPVPVQFDETLMEILKDKLEWIRSFKFPGNILQEYFTQLYIKEGYYGIAAPTNDKEYENILEQELHLLDHRIAQSVDDLIRIFYIKQELKARHMAKIKTITKQESDKMINQKVKDYEEIIGLLKMKKIVLQEIVDHQDTNELTRINTKIEIIKVQREIESKTEFRKRYAERKNIIS